MNRLSCFFIILILAIPLSIHSQTRIKMKKEKGGVYTLPCEVNGLKLRFILDTGASDVCISLTEAMFMLKNGYISKNDFVGSSKSMIANGTIVDDTQIILREIKIGDLILTDVEATITHELVAPLLLGQSVIQRLGTIQLKGDELVILNPKKVSNRASKSSTSTSAPRRSQPNRTTTSKSPASSANKEKDAKALIAKAEDYREKGKYKNAISAYKEAYITDKTAFALTDFLYWGNAYKETGDLNNALYYYGIAKREATNLKETYIQMHGVESWFGLERVITIFEMEAYIADKNYNQAISTGKSILSDMKRNNVVAGACEIYKLMSVSYYYMDDNSSSIKMAEAGIDSYIYDNFGKGKTLRNLRAKDVKDDYIGSTLYLIGLNYDELKNTKSYNEYIKRAKEFGFVKTDNPIGINVGRTIAGSLDSDKKNTTGNEEKATVPSRRAPNGTKRYTLGQLTIDVINNDNWSTSVKTDDTSSILTAKSKQNLSAITILYLNKRLEEEVMLDLMRNMVDGDNIVLGRKQRSQFNIPGSIQVPYTYSDDDRMKGVFNIFTEKNSSYLIMTLEPANFKSREFEQVYNSIKLR